MDAIMIMMGGGSIYPVAKYESKWELSISNHHLAITLVFARKPINLCLASHFETRKKGRSFPSLRLSTSTSNASNPVLGMKVRNLEVATIILTPEFPNVTMNKQPFSRCIFYLKKVMLQQVMFVFTNMINSLINGVANLEVTIRPD